MKVTNDRRPSSKHRPFLSKGVLGVCCDKTGMKKKKPEAWGLGPGGAEGGTFESASAATEDYHAADAIILESMLAPLDIALECVACVACLVVGHLHMCPTAATSAIDHDSFARRAVLVTRRPGRRRFNKLCIVTLNVSVRPAAAGQI
jgi:hypothetical protein